MNTQNKKNILCCWLFFLLIPWGVLGQKINNSGSKVLSKSENEALFSNFINTGTFELNGKLHFFANYTDNGTTLFKGTTGTVHWEGLSRQEIKGLGVTDFNNVVFNNSNHFLLEKDITVAGECVFKQGIVYCDDPKKRGILIFKQGAFFSNASDLSCVDGKVRKEGNTAFRFPVGDNSYYRYAGISAPENIADAFTAQYFEGDATIGKKKKDIDVVTVDNLGFWTIERTQGSSTPDVTLSWDLSKVATTMPTDLNMLVVVRWDGSKWVNEGQEAIVGDKNAGAITAKVRDYGIFTLGERCPTEIPVVNLVEADCTTSPTVTIGNYDAMATYSLSGGLTHKGPVIEGFVLGKTYTLTVIKNGCGAMKDFKLAPFDYGNCDEDCTIPIPSLSAVTQPSCSQRYGALQITNYDAHLTYSFQPLTASIVDNSGNVRATEAGSYVVTVTDGAGCEKTAAFTIEKVPTDADCGGGCTIPIPSLSAVAQPSCSQRYGALQIMNYDAHLTYSFQPLTASIVDNSGNIRATEAGSYVVTAADGAGCEKTAAFTIKKIPTDADCEGECTVPIPSLSSVIQPSCSQRYGALQIMNYDVHLTYSFQPLTASIVDDSGNVQATEAGSYVVTVTDGTGCEKTASFIIEEIPTEEECSVSDCGTKSPIFSEVVQPTCDVHYGSVFITNYDSSHSYTIMPNDVTFDLKTGEIFKAIPGVTYLVIATFKGCDSRTVGFTIDKIPEECLDDRDCEELWEDMIVFQLLSPNGDGINDVWELEDLEKYSKYCLKDMDKSIVRIFNRYGSLVYEKENYMQDEERFDGSNSGSMSLGSGILPAGTYYYIISVEGRVGKTGYLYITASER